jgi:hypothetical protein
MKPLLFAIAATFVFFASPALAGWTPWYGPWVGALPWTCSKFEYRHWCNAEWTVRTHRCGCLVR